LLISDLL